MQIFRVQDREGRGPFKPGFSNKWLDKNKDRSKLPVCDEFTESLTGLPKGKHFGYGCRTIDQLFSWFSLTELAKLRGFGYQVVKIRADVVIAESNTQVLFGRKKHLAAHAKVVKI